MKIIGIIILILVFALLFGASCAVYGVKTALITWALDFLFSITIIVAVFLILEG